MNHQNRLAYLFPAEDRIPESARVERPIEQREYLLDGEIRRWEGPLEDVLSPICLETPGGPARVRLGATPRLDGPAALRALDAARRAWDHGRGAWPTATVAERIARVEEFAFRMKEQREPIVRLLMWEIGKTRRDSEKEFDRTLRYVADTVEAVKDLDRAGSRFVDHEGILAQIRRAPLGVTLCMGPFNYPLNETFTVLIPALIMGNPVVMKPPKLGVLLWRHLLEAFRDSFPAGVVNTVYGDGREVVGPLMESGGVDVLAFIGTSRVADILKKQHPRPHRLRSVLGLDAKNPAIVLPHADLDLAVRESVTGALSFNGQRCTALKLFFVHESVADAFVLRLRAAVSALGLGMPWDPGAAITPLPEDGKAAYLEGLIADARAHGADVVNENGGASRATLVTPAVLYPVTARMRVYHEEQFGPVVPVAVFRDPAEPIRFIEESNFGQQVSLFGTDPRALAEMIDPLVNQVCRVNLNSQCQRGPDTFPFTGRKDSAEGTLSVSDALRVFSIRTLVAAKREEINERILSAIVRKRSSRFLSTDFLF